MNTELLKRVVIREARSEDDAAIGDLLVEAFVTQYAQKLPEVVYTEERKRSLRDTASKRAVAKVLVAELEGRVVGTVALWPPGAPGSEAWVPGANRLRRREPAFCSTRRRREARHPSATDRRDPAVRGHSFGGTGAPRVVLEQSDLCG